MLRDGVGQQLKWALVLHLQSSNRITRAAKDLKRSSGTTISQALPCSPLNHIPK